MNASAWSLLVLNHRKPNSDWLKNRVIGSCDWQVEVGPAPDEADPVTP